jgi:signal transduction histidine kinase
MSKPESDILDNNGKQEGDSGSVKILIIDDQPANLAVVGDYLIHLGFEILVSQDGESGLKRAEYVKPDLILLDVLMPGMDGFEVCRRLKKNNITKDIPVIFMTAVTDMAARIKAFQIGGVDYISKPVQQEEVVARVKNHLKISEQNIKLYQQAIMFKQQAETVSKINQQLEQEIKERLNTEEALHKSQEQLEIRITERTAELVESNQKLKELDDSKNRFISLVSHELRTPLASIIGFAQTLLEDVSIEKGESDRYLRIIESEGLRLNRMVTNLLDIAKIEKKITELISETFDLAALARQTVCEMRIPSTLTVKINDGKEIPVNADREKIKQVFINIISNATRHMNPGGVITISFVLRPSDTLVTIQDTGTGIPKENLLKIFDFFYQVETGFAKKEGGSGLGLSICKEIIKAHGGCIWATSKVGTGSTFFFTIPLKKFQ